MHMRQSNATPSRAQFLLSIKKQLYIESNRYVYRARITLVWGDYGMHLESWLYRFEIANFLITTKQWCKCKEKLYTNT